MSNVLDKIKSRGYWHVAIRPAEFVENRIESLGKCKELIRELAVHFRGWDYPHYDTRNQPTSGIDYVEQSLDWQDKIEFWRFYQSGQFVHYFGIWEDWQDQRTLYGSRLDSKPGQILSIVGAVYHFTEIYEFASRLAVKNHLGKDCKISITVHGTKGRLLTMLDPGRLLFGNYRSTLDSISREASMSTETLISKAPELAMDHAVWVFQRFNWDNIPRGVLQEDQKKLLERRL